MAFCGLCRLKLNEKYGIVLNCPCILGRGEVQNDTFNFNLSLDHLYDTLKLTRKIILAIGA